ncbi:MAG: hypothetical protein ACJ8G5_11520 [Burkholderiales bacterium]
MDPHLRTSRPAFAGRVAAALAAAGEWVKHLRAHGLALPGMPAGAPGMEQGTRQPYATIAFGPDGSRVFARH